MKTLNKIRENISRIKLSHRAQHTQIQSIFKDLVDYIEDAPPKHPVKFGPTKIKLEPLETKLPETNPAEAIISAIDEALSKLGKE